MIQQKTKGWAPAEGPNNKKRGDVEKESLK